MEFMREFVQMTVLRKHHHACFGAFICHTHHLPEPTRKLRYYMARSPPYGRGAERSPNFTQVILVCYLPPMRSRCE